MRTTCDKAARINHHGPKMSEQSKSRLDTGNFNIADFTPFRMAVAAGKFSEQVAKIYRNRFDISIPEWRVLAHITQEGAASVRDIEARVTMEKSKVSRATDRLRDRGLVSKRTDTVDRRLLLIELTPEGQSLMKELLPEVAAIQRQLEEELGDDFAGLDRALTRILEGSESENPDV
jgi:DNA-binding MarR family transcriptional regulator